MGNRLEFADRPSAPNASRTPTLFIFGGLPGTGKTALSQHLARQVGAAHLRIDTIEQALRDLCSWRVEGEGYGMAYRIAADNLRMGMDVVADSCNPLELTRREWEHVASENAAQHVNIEVVCGDPVEHRCRVEARETDIPHLRLPTWHEVETREYHAWTTERIVVDTAGRTVEQSCSALMDALARQPRP